MFCLHCGNRLPDDAVFCNRCGRQVQALASDTTPPGRITTQFGDNGQATMPTSLPPQPSSPNWPQPQPDVREFPPLYPARSGWSQVEPTVQAFPPQSPSGAGWSQLQPVSSPLSQPPLMTTPAQLVSPSGLQRLLIRIFQPALASNAFLGVLLGGILAVVLGVLLSDLVLAAAHAINASLQYTSYTSSEDSVDFVLGIIPLHSAFRNSLQFFLVMHGVVIHILTASNSASNSGNGMITLSNPLNGFLVIPALLLTFGGYIAASTDFQNNWRTSLLRGAAIAIPYTILLLIMVSQANGCIPFNSGNAPCIDSSALNASLSMDVPTVIIFGLSWGVLFGLLGASFKLGRGQWQHMILHYLYNNARPWLTGMITGGMAAAGLGFALALLTLFGALAYTLFSIPLVGRSLCYLGLSNYSSAWQILTTWGLAQGPLHAANLYLFSFGAPITISATQQLSCFYTSDPHTVLSLTGGSIHLPSWMFAVLVLPVISLFMGGRVSAAVGRIRGMGPGAIQGALIAVPFTVLMLLLAVISTVAETATGSATSGGSSVQVQSAGVGAFDLLLWALLSSAVLGALGGMYQASALKPGVSRFLHALATPLRVLSSPFYLLLDHLSGLPRSDGRTHTRNLLYGAFLCALLLTIVAGAAGGALLAFNQAITFEVNQRVKDIVSVLVIVLPGLLLISACARALSEDPTVKNQGNAPVMQALQTIGGQNLHFTQ